MVVNVAEELKRQEKDTGRKDMLMVYSDIDREAPATEFKKPAGEYKAESVKPHSANTKAKRKESNRKMKEEKNNTIVKKPHFVEFSYASRDGFERFEAVKEAMDIIHNAVRHTGGDMPWDLIDAYDGLADVMEHIKAIELDVIKRGR